jgi:1-acyl-sn-glycerol-3-phosphate acyltransferase
MLVRYLYHYPAYWITLLLFALGGLELSLLSFLCGWLPATQRTERFFQRLVRRHFAAFHGWASMIGLMRIRYRGFESLPAGGLVIVANHPALIDVTCILARVPEALCIFKPAIRRNPVLGAAARRAGYIGNDGGHDLVRAAAGKVAAGHKLVVFPEGTRTPASGTLLPFKPGFALIARRAGVPIQLVRIAPSAPVLGKGAPWWRLPRVPVTIEVSAGPLINVDSDAKTTEVVAEIESWCRDPVSVNS